MASAAALVRFTRRAQRLAELQMDFVAGVSHELRTPLTVIHTAAYNLRGKLANDPGQVEKYGELIQRESGRLAEMVDEVLRFAGSATGRTTLEREPVYVEVLIEEALESSKATMEGAGCVVEKTIDPELPPVLGDPSALKRVFSNLLSNAAKHGGQGGGWIGIAASKARENGRDAIEVRVSDRGPGIPADEQRQVFDPFFRGRRAVREQIHGSGLGLNLVKRIVEAHGGTIRVRSEPGKLTEFTVHLTALAEGQK
jgi:signal transduction histidine kinase